ncbi:MAG: hypothetical protein WCO29_21475 [Nostocales cyanobacterium ELA583]
MNAIAQQNGNNRIVIINTGVNTVQSWGNHIFSGQPQATTGRLPLQTYYTKAVEVVDDAHNIAYVRVRSATISIAYL